MKSYYLRKRRALSPNRAIMADDGSIGEMVACAINITHQMIINISLPRHLVLCFFFLIVVLILCCVVLWCVLYLSTSNLVLNKGWIMDEGWCSLYHFFTLPPFSSCHPITFSFILGSNSLFSYSCYFMSTNRLEIVNSSTELLVIIIINLK